MICILPAPESDEVKQRRDAFYRACVRELLDTALERDDHYARTIADVLLSASGYKYTRHAPWKVDLGELAKFGESTRGQIQMVLDGAMRGTKPAQVIQGGDPLFHRLWRRWLNPEIQHTWPPT